MKTTQVGPGDGADLFAPTGYDEAYQRAADRSLTLSRWTSRVELPATIELPTDTPTIVAANHSSLFDLAASLITVAHYGASARMGVAARYFDRPMIGSFLDRIGCIPFSRDRVAEAENDMIGSLKEGQLCCLMPEGRIVRSSERSVEGRAGPGRPGISRIAAATGAAILPVGFSGADEAWRPGRPLPRLRRKAPVVARIGPPFLFEGDDHEANAEQLMHTIAGLIRRPVAVGETSDRPVDD
ncbi:MAG: lysophospholipid acyltransferase family protein [Actinomycetota bacterium]